MLATRLRVPVACVVLCRAVCRHGAGEAHHDAAEDNIYADEIIFSRDTRYQHIVLTAWKDDLRLFLNSHLQFSSRDEYRYHEALVHPGLAARAGARRVLVLGGGDGLAVREILKYPQIESITLVDLDPEMTQLFSTHPLLTALNSASSSPKVHVINADAFPWWIDNTDSLRFHRRRFSGPDQLFAGEALHDRVLSRAGAPSERAGLSSCRARRRCLRGIVLVHRGDAQAGGLETYPYHVYVPSFGEWGFVHWRRAQYAAADVAAGRIAVS